MIYVDHDKLDAAAQDFGHRHDALEGILDKLEADLAPMVAGWEGSAQVLYVEKKAAWEKASRDLNGLLKSIKDVTRNAHEGYKQTVSNNASMWE